MISPLPDLFTNYCRYHLKISTKAAMTVLAVVLFQNTSAKYIKYNCTHPDEFLYAVPGSRCRFYYKCNADKKPETVECPPESIFDFYSQSCSREEGICYEPVCAGKLNGLYQDTTHACRRSYVCHGGSLDSIDNCPHTQIHSGNQCESSNRVFCESPSTTSIAYPFPGDRRCAGLTNGKHVADNTDCSRFITCQNAKVISDIECAEFYRYHERMGQCVPKHLMDDDCRQGNDHKLCKFLSNGYHIDPSSSDCQRYIKCKTGRFISRENCGLLSVFNGTMCVPKPLFHCPHQYYDLCKNKANGLLGDPRKSCRSYVKCLSGKTIEQLECPPLHVFEPQRKLCAMDNGQCQKKQLLSNECLQLEMGYYLDKSPDSSCRDYFFCYNGIRTNFRCPIGTIFDSENCVAESSYTCPNQNSNSCISKTDGYYRDDRGSCRAYFYCSGGRKFRYVCSDKQYFNGSICVPRPVGYTCQNVLPCIGKSDGYYADLNSMCRMYYFCLNEEILTTLTCSGSKVYNGHKCVESVEYQCPVHGSRASANCVQRKQCTNECSKTGFFADFDSGCVRYFFCIGDNKTVLTCKDDFIFNGDLCVPRHRYTCPKYCNEIT